VRRTGRGRTTPRGSTSTARTGIPLDITIDDFSDAKLELLGRYIKHPPEWYEIPINMDSPPQLALGTIDSFSIAPVPEPAWTVAALLGAAAWAVRLRRIG